MSRSIQQRTLEIDTTRHNDGDEEHATFLYGRTTPSSASSLTRGIRNFRFNSKTKLFLRLIGLGICCLVTAILAIFFIRFLLYKFLWVSSQPTSVSIGSLAMYQRRRSLPVKIRADAPLRLNILMGPLLTDLTGSSLSIMRFASRMLERGFHVRWINIFGGGLSFWEVKAQIKGLASLQPFENIEFIEQVLDESNGKVITKLPSNPSDLFMATSFATARMAHEIASLEGMSNKNMIYFIQDVDSNSPHSSEFIEMLQSYTFPHFGIYSSSLLQDHFRQNRLGAYNNLEEGTMSIMKNDWAAEPATKKYVKRIFPEIDNTLQAVVAPPAAAAPVVEDYDAPLILSVVAPELQAQATVTAPSRRLPRRVRTVVVNAGPNMERNAFDMALLALDLAVRNGAFGSDYTEEEMVQYWKFVGLGSVDQASDLKDYCGIGGIEQLCLTMQRYMKEPEYFSFLNEQGDIGLSLMLSPRLSVPALDYAAAGIVTVTNSFGVKTREKLSSISKNLVVAISNVESIAVALSEAVYHVDDFLMREKHAEIMTWPSEWNDPRCYGDELVTRVQLWMSDSYQKPLWEKPDFQL